MGIIQSIENEDQPKLYVEQKPEPPATQKQGLPQVENENTIPPDLAVPTETDEAAQQQIDRVFETYKELAQKQKQAADAQIMKSEATKNSPQNAQKTSSGGIAGILEQYQSGKDAPVHTQTLTITDPAHFSGKTNKAPE